MQRSTFARVVQALVIGYVALALVTRAKEAAGVYICDCADDCWCKRPGLSLFRWVYPRGHRNRALETWKSSHED